MRKSSKIQKVRSLFETGKSFTPAQITKRTGAQSPRSVIRYLRDEGYDIVAVRVRNNAPRNVYQLAA